MTSDSAAEATPWDAAAHAFAAWRDGDASAFNVLVRTLTPVLWHVSRSYGLPQDRAEDVIQGAWLALVRGAASVQDPQAVGGWMLTTTRRAAWRASARDAAVKVVSDEQLAQQPDRARTDDTVLDEIDTRRMWAAVAALPERCQRLLRIIAFDDRPDYAGVARDLHMPIGSIGPTRRRCLDKLRLELEGA